MPLHAALRAMTDIAQAAGFESPDSAAQWLVGHALDRPALTWQLCDDQHLTEQQALRCAAYAERAAQHEPVQYIVGETAFLMLRLKCDRRALIPRPETEQWVARVLEGTPVAQAIDVGTGTGCIALSVAQAWPKTKVVAIDREADALALAKENAALNKLQDGRVSFRHGDLLDGVAPDFADLILANLPYVTSMEWNRCPPCVRDHEPRSALDGGNDGLLFIQKLATQALAVLKSGGRLFLEIGADQGGTTQHMLKTLGYKETALERDWSGRDRVAVGVRP